MKYNTQYRSMARQRTRNIVLQKSSVPHLKKQILRLCSAQEWDRAFLGNYTRWIIYALIFYLLLNLSPGFGQAQRRIAGVIYHLLSVDQITSIMVNTRAGAGESKTVQNRKVWQENARPKTLQQQNQPGEDAHSAQGSLEKPRIYNIVDAANLRPTSPNPLLAFLPAGAKPEHGLWQARMQAETLVYVSQLQKGAPTVNEVEPNNNQTDATFLSTFGTAAADQAQLDVEGTLTPPPSPAPVGPFGEDDGSIGTANVLALSSRNSARFSGTVGDGPYGSSGQAKGDFDLFRVVATAGQTIVVDIDTPSPTEDLDSIVAIYSASGTLLAFNDDDLTGNTYDSYLEYTVSTNGTYYVAIAGFTSFPTGASSFLQDPFDSGSGPGVGSEGIYQATIGLDVPVDVDYFSFELRAGDIVGASITGNARLLEFFDPASELMIGSSQDVTAVYPEASPLPRGGNAVLSAVVAQDGLYAIAVTKGSGVYELELAVYRPVLEQGEPQTEQTLFLDFDGAALNPVIFGGSDELRMLSPLSAFIPNWGLSVTDESAVIDAIVASAVENLATDVRGITGSGRNGDYAITSNAGEFAIRILNSRDHADPFGQPNVSRIIIGGTIEESGMQTIGIAQSIDVGNFDTTESAIVLLDLLSAAASNPNSLNRFGVDSSSTKIALVGTGVGNIVAHEAGHFFGNWHTDNHNHATPNLMDQGGNLPNTIGTGEDNIFGTADDTDVDFGPDVYAAEEDFRGIQDTLQSIAFGLSTGARGARLEVQQAAKPSIVSPGASATIGISITNHGPATATNLVIHDQLVSLLTGLSFVGSSPAGNVVQQNEDAQENYVWQVASLGNGETATIVVTGVAHPDLETEGEFVNVVTVTADQMDENSQSRAEEIIKINLPPVADAGGPYSVQSGSTTQLAASASDPGNDQLTYRWDLNEDGTYDDATGPDPTFDATTLSGPRVINISVRVRDEDGAVSTADSTILVTDASSTANAGGPYTVDEGGNITLDGVSIGAAFSKALLYEWDLDEDGEYDDAQGKAPVFDASKLDGPLTLKVAVRITDEDNGSVAIGTTTVTVENVAPTANAGSGYSVVEGGTIDLSGTASDASQDDQLTYSWDLDGDGLFTDATGHKPSFDATGIDGPGSAPVLLRVTDDDGSSSQSSATITITNAPPIARADEATVVQSLLIIIDALENDGDPGGDPLVLKQVDEPNNGTAEIDGAAVAYRADAEFEGVDSFDYVVDDGDGGQATGTITVRVTLPPEEQSPLPVNDVVTTTQESSIIIPVLDNDVEPTASAMEVLNVGLPRNGTAATDNQTITYMPTTGFIGTDTFIYTVINEYGREAVAVVMVTVIPGGGVTGVVFGDANANGQQDGDEVGVPDVIITLGVVTASASQTTNVVWATEPLTATTDANGIYRFPLVPPGNYSLGMEDPIEDRNLNIVVSMNASGAIEVDNPLAPVTLPVGPPKPRAEVYLPFVMR